MVMKGTYKDLYVLEARHLGKGGQAEVFAATHRSTKERVALKRLREIDEDSVARMRREIEVQTSLRHHHIMPIKDFDQENYHWYTMPVAVSVLSQFKFSDISRSLLVEITRACCEALRHAHGQGYIHRDITPRNIFRLMTGDRHSWVLGDWGCVRRPLGMTTVARSRPGEFLGTPGFAAPEMWEDPHLVDTRADIYSLGRVVAWARTGKEPIPNRRLIPDDDWREFVVGATKEDAVDRISDFPTLLEKIPPFMDAPSSPRALFDLADDATEIVWARYADSPTIAVRNHGNEISLRGEDVGLILPYLYARKYNHRGTGLLRVREAIAWGKTLWKNFPSPTESKVVVAARKSVTRRMRAAGVSSTDALFWSRQGLAPATMIAKEPAKIVIIE
ncbi:protein kinase [Nannocystis pusilla]|uniref:Protein kinase n=1 Tax=Nannocystis pusilla TaxID=889268 RepID=A0A9X3ER27_9BACT|nr:protein kinase [Nannocystis pusilla]MCY1008587.1 protein kinase [Nannocystis pusilla]